MSSGSLAAKLTAIVAGSVPIVNVLTQLADAIAEHLDSREFEQTVTSALKDLKREVRAIPVKVALQNYRDCMTLGRRLLRDLWVPRSPDERWRIIEQAKYEFAKAAAIAENLASNELSITAELAVAGCWHLLGKDQDVAATLGAARRYAEVDVLTGKPAIVNRYRQVLELGQALGAMPPHHAIPLDPATAPLPGAALTAYAPLRAPAYLLGVQIQVNAVDDLAADFVLTNWTEGFVTIRLRPADGSKFAGDGDPHQVEPNAARSAALRLNGYGQAGCPLAVTVELHAYQMPGSRYGPFLTFLLPEPWQAAAIDQFGVQPGEYGPPLYDDPYPYQGGY